MQQEVRFESCIPKEDSLIGENTCEHFKVIGYKDVKK
jgi:hypothetical protein